MIFNLKENLDLSSITKNNHIKIIKWKNAKFHLLYSLLRVKQYI